MRRRLTTMSNIENILDPTTGRLKKRTKWFLISPKNPYSVKFFRSEQGIKREEIRHLLSGYQYIVHPFSSFRTGYSIYQVVLYLTTILFGPFESSFAQDQHCAFPLVTFSILLDALSLIDIMTNFILGYVDHTGAIVLEPKRIAKMYLRTFFIFDLLGSLPFCTGFKILDSSYFRVILSAFSVLRIVRLYTVIKLMDYLRTVFEIKYARSFAVISTTLVFFGITHNITCLHTLYYRTYVRLGFPMEDWLGKGYWQQPVLKQYMVSFFRVSMYILSMYWPIKVTEVGYTLQILMYFAGKILLGVVWISFATIILKFSYTTMNYSSKMNQLEEYMRIRRIPKTLQKKLKRYYRFKFRKIGFNENAMRHHISDCLQAQMDQRFKMILMKSIPLFKFFGRKKFRSMPLKFIYEIFTPQSLVFQYGDTADCMYFLYSGTVAMYSPAGKEVFHLSDGSYFGELSLISNRTIRSVTVITLEFCEMLKVSRKQFVSIISSNKKVTKLVRQTAVRRLRKVKIADEDGIVRASVSSQDF